MKTLKKQRFIRQKITIAIVGKATSTLMFISYFLSYISVLPRWLDLCTTFILTPPICNWYLVMCLLLTTKHCVSFSENWNFNENKNNRETAHNYLKQISEIFRTHNEEIKFRESNTSWICKGKIARWKQTVIYLAITNKLMPYLKGKGQTQRRKYNIRIQEVVLYHRQQERQRNSADNLLDTFECMGWKITTNRAKLVTGFWSVITRWLVTSC